MSAVDLLCDLMAEGVEFEANGDRVRWRNGGMQLTPDRLAVLKDGKAEVLQFLNKQFEIERAAIAKYDGAPIRANAEHLAAQWQGYENVFAFRASQKKINED